MPRIHVRQYIEVDRLGVLACWPAWCGAGTRFDMLPPTACATRAHSKDIEGNVCGL